MSIGVGVLRPAKIFELHCQEPFASTSDLFVLTVPLMRRTASILFAVMLAMLVTPLRLPAASCILLNAPSREGCKPSCCANKACCAVSKKNTGTASQPLSQNGSAKHQVIGFISIPIIGSHVLAVAAGPVFFSAPLRAHSPPPLAATCIRLI
jgi:hypothetical protein